MRKIAKPLRALFVMSSVYWFLSPNPQHTRAEKITYTKKHSKRRYRQNTFGSASFTMQLQLKTEVKGVVCKLMAQMEGLGMDFLDYER